MKKIIILGVLILATVGASLDANAQLRKKKTPGTGTTPTTTTGNPPTTTGTPPPTGGGGASKSFDTTASASGNEYGAQVKPSLRNVFGFDNSNTQVKDRTPLAYEHLREDDIMFSHFIWREIDSREKMNKVFSYPSKENGQDQRFFAIILDALKDTSNHVVAFSADDDRFTTPLTYDTVMQMVSESGGISGYDTSYVQNLYNQNVFDTVIQKKSNPFAPKPDSIYTFRILEQVMFDKESSRLFTRILGIAPIAMIATQKGQPSRRQMLFWVYYPDLRAKLAKTFAYNPRNASGRMTWEEIFESRFFSSYIVKSSMDNPTNASLRELIKDPLFRLLEGENIKEKIFNYEQNLWAY
jgi:gliding motility associated protien GldN